MPLTPSSTVPLNDGRAIPRLGFGVYQVRAGDPARLAIGAALEAGYRHVDTARIYGNEADVGAAVRASGLPRDEVFVTSKVWNDAHGYEKALDAGRRSADRIGLGPIDLYLIHWPGGGERVDTWKALVTLRETGVVRSIGVSNYEERHLDEAIAATGVVPAVNQYERHPYLQRRALTARCRELGIVVENYSPLVRGERMADPDLVAVARDAGRSPAQVLVRWALQKGDVVLPRSSRPERIRENAAVFDWELTTGQMARLDALEEGLRVAWDPTGIP